MPTYASFLPTFLPCLFIFLACGSVIAHPSVLKPFFLPAIPEEVSRKQGSRTRRLARPDVSQQTSRNKRLARGLARPVVSRQTLRKDRRTYFPLFFLFFFHACSSFYPLFGSVFASFGPLTFLSISYLKKCLASTGL